MDKSIEYLEIIKPFFPNAFINNSNELILIPKINLYFMLDDVSNMLEFNCKMIEWTLNCVKELDGDLLEMYCGAGNFSVPLALHFDNVIGTEIAKPSVQAAQYNIALA